MREDPPPAPAAQQAQQGQQGRQAQQAQQRRPASAGPAASLATALSLQPPAPKRQRRGVNGPAMHRQPSAAELVVGTAAPPLQLPAVEPLLLHPTPPAPVASPLPAPLTPHAPEEVQRSRQHAAALAEQQAALAHQAATASAMAAQAGSGADVAAAAAAHRYAKQYSAAAQHAAHAATLHQQLSYEQAVLSSVGSGRDSLTGGLMGAAGSGSGSMSLAQVLGSGAATSAHYRHLRPAGMGAATLSGSESEHTAPLAGSALTAAHLTSLPSLAAAVPHPTSAAAAAATAAAAAAAGSLPTSVLLGGSLGGALGGGLPYGGMGAMGAMGAGPLGSAAAYGQRSVPTSQLTPQVRRALGWLAGWFAMDARQLVYYS